MCKTKDLSNEPACIANDCWYGGGNGQQQRQRNTAFLLIYAKLCEIMRQSVKQTAQSTIVQLRRLRWQTMACVQIFMC